MTRHDAPLMLNEEHPSQTPMFARYEFLAGMRADMQNLEIPFTIRIERGLENCSHLLEPCIAQLFFLQSEETGQALQELEMLGAGGARGCRLLKREEIPSLALLLTRRRNLCVSPGEQNAVSRELEHMLGDGPSTLSVLLTGVRFHGRLLGILTMRRPGSGSSWSRGEQTLAGKVGEIFSSGLDVREKQLLTRNCVRWKTLHRISFENAGTAMVLFDQNRIMKDVNSDALSLSEYSRGDLIGKDWSFLIHEDDQSLLLENHESRRQGKNIPQKYEFRLVTRTGQVKNLWATITPVPGTGERLASLNDITELRQALHEVSSLSRYDSLTGVLKRTIFMDRVEQAASWFERGRERGFAVLFLDICRFNLINDVFGCASGDSILREYASRIAGNVFEIDTVARFGGDQFLVLLRDIPSVERVVDVVRRIVQSFRTPFRIQESLVNLDVRIGIALAQGSETLEAGRIVQNAISAMEQAKQKGIEYTFYEKGMQKGEIERLTLEVELRSAVENNRIELFYQPLYLLQEPRIIGFEALARWNHPDRHWIPPSRFIPLAEETGLIIPLGTSLLKKACIQLKKWERDFPMDPPRVSVNISGRQLLDPSFIFRVRDCFEQSGANPELLTIEITESSLIHDLEHAGKVLAELKKMGIRFSLDDFGTGYSSLDYLQKLSPHIVKLDKSFVSTEGEEGIANQEIVTAVLSLAKNMRLAVVAEGIETEQQLRSLTDWGFDIGQGFFLSHPLPADEAEDLLWKERTVV